MGKLIKLARIGLITLAALFGLALLGLSLPGGGRHTLSVQTGSMEPAIKTGSMVWVKEVPVQQLAVGDVITYINPRNAQQTITHRITDMNETSGGATKLVTKGDANPSADAPIAESKVVGKVERNVPYVGRVLDFVRTWPGLILLVIHPALIVILLEIRKLIAYYRSIEPYVLPEVLAARKRPASGHMAQNLLLGGLVGLVVLASAIPAFAAQSSQATLTGNTIKTKPGRVLGDNDHKPWKCRKAWYGRYCECNCKRDRHGRRKCETKRDVDRRHKKDWDSYHRKHQDYGDHDRHHHNHKHHEKEWSGRR